MRKPRVSNIVLMSACAATVCVSCSSGTGDGPNAAANVGAVSGAAGGMAGEMTPQCTPEYQGFSVGPESGLVQTDPMSGISVRLLDASSNPPLKGDNTWKIGLYDASGAPAVNAHITWACAYMSVHKHGANPKGLESLGNGEYTLVKQNLRMFGPWEIRLWLDPTGAAPTYAPEKNPVNIVNGNPCEPTSGPAGAPNIEFKVCVPRSS